MHTSLGDVRHHKPVIYQEIAGVRREIGGRFVKLSRQEVGFAIDNYDRGYSLVIDPTINFSTFLGGTGQDQALAVAVDPWETLSSEAAPHPRIFRPMAGIQARTLHFRARRAPPALFSPSSFSRVVAVNFSFPVITAAPPETRA